MSTVAKLHPTGQFNIVGFVDEDMPPVQDGLQSLWPLKHGLIGRKYSNILPYENWVIGSSGSQTFFGQNGDGNQIIEDTDPWGRPAAIWQAIGNDATSNADGGWDSSQFAVDPAYTYRYTTWMKRVVLGNGSYYFGCHGYVSGTNTIRYDGSTSTTTNPYFIAGSWGYELDEWFLFVGHVWYDGYGGGHHVDSGVWRTNGTKRASISNDYQWAPNTTTGNHRSYLYYSTLAATDQRWCYPRVDKLDGTEPSLQDLLDGKAYGPVSPEVATNVTELIDGVAVEEPTTNIVTNTNLDTGWGQSYNTSIRWNDYPPPVGLDSPVVSFIENGTDGGSYWYSYGNYAIQNPSTTYAISLWARTVGGNINIRAYTADNSELGRQYTGYETIVGNGDWQLLEFDIIVTPSNTESDSLSFQIDSFDVGQRMWLCAPQMEAKAWYTSFVTGTRATNGVLRLPMDAGTNGTIAFTVNKKWYSTVGSNENGAFIAVNLTKLYIYTGNTTTLQLWAANTAGTETNRITQASAINLNTDYRIALVWSGADVEMFLDGVSCGTFNDFGYSYLAGQDLYVGCEGSASRAGNVVVKDVAIYDRALALTEVVKDVNHALSINSSGDVHNIINESSPTEAMKMHRDGTIEIDEIIEGL